MKAAGMDEKIAGLKQENAAAWTNFGKNMLSREEKTAEAEKVKLAARKRKHHDRENLLRQRFGMPARP